MRITNNNKLDKRYKTNWFKVVVMSLIGLFVIWVANWFYLNGDRLKEIKETTSEVSHGAVDEPRKVVRSSFVMVEDNNIGGAVRLPTQYPASHEERHEVIDKYLEILGESMEDRVTWRRILDCESGATANNEAHDLDTQNPYSSARGPFQLMASTVIDYQNRIGVCYGAYDTWQCHIDCAIQIRNYAGFNSWECY